MWIREVPSRDSCPSVKAAANVCGYPARCPLMTHAPLTLYQVHAYACVRFADVCGAGAVWCGLLLVLYTGRALRGEKGAQLSCRQQRTTEALPPDVDLDCQQYRRVCRWNRSHSLSERSDCPPRPSVEMRTLFVLVCHHYDAPLDRGALVPATCK